MSKNVYCFIRLSTYKMTIFNRIGPDGLIDVTFTLFLSSISLSRMEFKLVFFVAIPSAMFPFWRM